MLNSSAYAEIIDRHIELYSRLAWVGRLLEYATAADDAALAKGGDTRAPGRVRTKRQ
jgi:hypothetical protein